MSCKTLQAAGILSALLLLLPPSVASLLAAGWGGASRPAAGAPLLTTGELGVAGTHAGRLG